MTRLTKIADSHAHIFPSKIAARASENIGKFYGIPMSCDGEAENLLKSGAKIGVSKYLVSSVATKPDQVRHINDFLYEQSQAHPEFMPLCTLHQDFEDNFAELERVRALGFYGVKLHPDFQRFAIDDPKLLPLFRRIAEYKMPVLFHTGDDRYEYSAPRRLAGLVSAVPDLTCIAAHFGGYRRWEEADRCLSGANVYFDTSSSLATLDRLRAREMIGHLGEDRFFFASDYPMWRHDEEYARFLALELTDGQYEKIFWRNFERLFDIQL